MKGRAWYGLAVLSVINLVNYLDRYILGGVLDNVQKEFTLNDAEGGLLGSVFLLVYTFASPLGGYLGDRVPRRYIISAAIFIWSLATIGSGLATSFGALLFARALTGFGEAGYGTVAPSVISDLFEKQQRSRMLALFYVAMPLGAAAGFVLGGAIGEHASWHHAYFAGGIPGLALGVLALFLPEPKRGAMDGGAAVAPPPVLAGLKALAGNARYVYVVVSLTLMTFSIGGLSLFMKKYLATERGFSGTDAGLALGATTVIGGLFGTLAGGFLGDRLERRTAGGSVMLSAVGLILAAPFMVGAVVLTDRTALIACLMLAQFFIFLNNGPLNAAIVNVVSPSLRAFAFGLSLLALHLLGDVSSPVVIGWISDHSSLGTAIIVNAVPVALGGLVLLPALKLFRHPPAVT